MIFPMLLIAQDEPAAQHRPVVFRNVTLIDMRNEQPKPNMSVLISGNRISKIGKNIKIPKDAEVIDATGKFMIPGLWDSFTYTLDAEKNNFPYFEMMVAHGVTDVRDAGTTMDLAEVERLQNDIVAGKILAPRLFYSGRYINGTNLNSLSRPSFQAKDEKEAAHYVEMLAQTGVDYISIGTFLPPEFVPSVVAAAKKYKLPVLSYVVYGYGRASDLGVNCIEHFADLDRSVSVKREDYFAFYRERRVSSVTPDEAYAFFKTLIDSRDQPFYKATLKTLARNKTCVATNFSEFGLARNTFDLTDLSRRRFKTKKQLEQLEAAILELERWRRNNDMRASEADTKRQLQGIYEMHKAGVPLLAGTQSNHRGIASPGIWLHDELYYFVQAGLSPFEALKTATVNPAKFMRRDRDLGTIEKGKLADLVLLDANPLADISNTRKINAVVVNGRYLSREFLDKMLSEVEAKAKSQ
jgi:imidazolonepropionase-like amidohydrolase